MNTETQFIGVVEKLSESGFSFHKRLLLLYANRLSYFSQVPPEAYTEDFNPSKALTLGLKQKAFVKMENVVSIVPNDELARKKKKKHVIDITFAKEALNNFSDAPTDGTSKKLVTWTFAIQQTEENKNWMDSLSTVMDTIRSDMKPEDAHLIEINRSSNKVSKLNTKYNSRNDLSDNEIKSKRNSDFEEKEKNKGKGQKENIEPFLTPELVKELQQQDEVQLDSFVQERKRLSSVDKKTIDKITERLKSPFAGRKKKHDAKMKKEILKRKQEEELRLKRDLDVHERDYRKAMMNEVFKTSWETKYNVILDKYLKNMNNFDELIDSEFKLAKFMKEFGTRAVETCRLIIDELPLPIQQRTHKAIQISSYDPDQEIPEMVFMLNNCIIRVTWTVGTLEEIPQSGEFFLYIEKLLKSYGNEFRVLNRLNDCIYLVNRKYKNVYLRVPLATIVDYKGFRCFVISSPPINGDETLFIGPSTTEGTYKVNRSMDEDLKFIAKNLNLKGHKYALEEKGANVDVPLSILVEVHKTTMTVSESDGNDGNTSQIQIGEANSREMECYYLMNTSEIIPVDVDIENSAPMSFLKRLRPEFVNSCEIPLSADAFINQFPNSDSQKDDFEVILAGKFLRIDLLPKFLERLESLDIVPFNSASLTNVFHANGINIRHLGLVYKKANLPHIKELCMREMISRSAKKILRKQLSDLIIGDSFGEQSGNPLGYPTEDPLLKRNRSGINKLEDERIDVVVDFLNLIFGTGKESEKFWWGVLNKQILYDFGFQLKKNKKLDIVYGGLLMSIIHHCNIQINFDEELEKNIGTALNPFNKGHIKGFGAKAKMFSMSKLEVKKFEEKCKEALELKRYNIAIKLFENLLNLEKVLQVENKTSNHLSYLEHLGDIYLEIRDLDRAVEIAKEGLQDIEYRDIEAVKFLIILMKVHMVKGETAAVEEIFYEIISYLDFNLGKYHPLHSTTYNLFGYYYVEKGQYNEALVLYRSSLMCLKKILGNDHPYTAEVYSELAGLAAKTEKNPEALEYYEKALEIYSKNKDQELEVATTNMEMAKLFFSIANLNDAMTIVVKAIQYFEKNEEKHFNNLAQCLILAMQISDIVYDWDKTMEFGNKIWDLVKNYDLDDQFEALDKTTTSMFNVYIHSQKGDAKTILLDTLESLEKVLFEENKNNEDILIKGDDNRKKELFKDILEKSANGITLQDWVKETLEQVIIYFNKNDIEPFFKKSFRKDSFKENEAFSSALENLEKFILAFGTDYIEKLFQMI